MFGVQGFFGDLRERMRTKLERLVNMRWGVPAFFCIVPFVFLGVAILALVAWWTSPVYGAVAYARSSR